MNWNLINDWKANFDIKIDFNFLQNLNEKILNVFGHLTTLIVIYTILCLLLYYIIFYRESFVKSTKLPKISHEQHNTSEGEEPNVLEEVDSAARKSLKRRALLVIAHPDDECMFFGPLILALNKDYRIFVLCLSKGNYKQLGNVRKNELWNSCQTLGIKSEDVILVNSPYMQDDPSQNWKLEIISSLILNHVESLDIDLLITFDKYGVSKHANHSSIYHAVAGLIFHEMLPASCKTYTLESVNVFRKYISILDLATSLLFSLNNCWAILSWKNRKVVQKAMKQHVSQMVWFRKLYIVFSRYMLINTLTELTIQDLELDILET